MVGTNYSAMRMRPRLMAVVAASVLSFAFSFPRQLATWLRAVLC